MPANKHAAMRYRIIDRCLQETDRQWRWQELAEACAEQIEELTGQPTTISERTIKDDLRQMRSNPILDYNAPIEYSRNDKSYYYSRSFKLTERIITNSDKEELSQAVSILRQFGAIKELSGLQSALAKIQTSIDEHDNNQRRSIQFDHPEDAIGQEWLHQLYQHISAQQAINLYYQPFNKALAVYKISPYLLKEYKYRWYLIGHSHKDKELRVYALDRIKNIIKSLDTFIANADEELYRFFDPVIGVTLHKDEKPIVIEFEAADSLVNYLLTSPIHHSQKLIGSHKTMSLFSIELIPNYELKRELLSYGKELKVISPKSMVNELKQEVLEMSKNYR